MKRISARWVVAGLGTTLLLTTGAGAAAPAPLEVGARAYGLGGAYTAVADDISALRWNPAGLSATRFEVGVAATGPGLETWQRLQALRDQLDDPAAWPDEPVVVDLKTVAGLSIGPLGAGGVAQGRLEITRTESGSNVQVRGEGAYAVDATLGLAAPVFTLPMGSARLTLGLTGRKAQQQQMTLERTYTNPSPTYTEVSERWDGQGYGADLGLLLGLSPYVQVGAKVENAFSRFEWQGKRVQEDKYVADDQPVPNTRNEQPLDPASGPPSPERNWRAGIAVRPPVLGLLLAADIEQDGTLHYGLEKGFLFNAVRVRVGQARPRSGQPVTTAGLGLALGPVHVDAAAGSTDGFRTYQLGVEAGLKF